MVWLALVVLLSGCLASAQEGVVRRRDNEDGPSEAFFAATALLSGHAGHAGEYGGMAVVDVDGDSHFELFVSGQKQKNRLLKWMTGAFVDVAHELGLDDVPLREGLGVAACDTDGDGVDEIYSIASSRAPGQRMEQGIRGSRQYSDHLYKRAPNATRYEDALGWISNKRQSLSAARVAACVDAEGSGVYDLYVGELGGGLRLLDPRTGEYSYVIEPPTVPSPKPGVPKVNASLRTPPQSFQAMVACPFSTGTPSSDLFCANSAGSNHLLMLRQSAYYGYLDHLIPIAGPAREPASFTDRTKTPVDNPRGLARAVAVLDEDGDGNMDLLVGNSEPSSDFAIDATGIKQPVDLSGHKFFRALGNGLFEDQTFPALRQHPSRVRGIVVADFDNDGYEEIFVHNAATSTSDQPNVLLRRTPGPAGNWTSVPLGPAAEETKGGTGAVVMDVDNDGKLELVLSHGDGAAAPLTVYRAANGKTHGFLRVLPLTPFGAPARGATVVLVEPCGRRQTRVIDGGGTQLAQHEPIAHFGLGVEREVLEVRITWADGRRYIMLNPRLNRLHRVEYPAYDQVDARRGNARKPSEEECAGVSGPGAAFRPRAPPVPRETPAMNIPREPFVVPKLDCYNGTGVAYRGTTARTASGHKCQPWRNMFPNFHGFLPVMYPNSDLRNNYCRNPSAAEKEPWCFTLDGNRSEVCGIDRCPERPMSGRAVFEASIASEADAAECAESPQCMSYEMTTCPARDIMATCREGMLFQRLRTKDGERCFCRKGRTVPCDTSPSNVTSICGNRTVLERIVTPTGTRCACMEYSSTQGIMGSLFSDQQAWRTQQRAPMSVRAQVAFRKCLKENQLGPLRCVAVMEKMGYAFGVYGNVKVSGEQEAFDRLDEAAREEAESAAAAAAAEKAKDEEDESFDDDGQKEPELVVDCALANAGDDNSTQVNPCEDPLTVFTRRVTEDGEVCSCRRVSYSVPCDPLNIKDVCMEGYVAQVTTGSHCTCTDLNLQASMNDGGFGVQYGPGEYWHEGCEQCHYGNGRCEYDKQVGYYCRCLEGYDGPDCMPRRGHTKGAAAQGTLAAHL